MTNTYKFDFDFLNNKSSDLEGFRLFVMMISLGSFIYFGALTCYMFVIQMNNPEFNLDFLTVLISVFKIIVSFFFFHVGMAELTLKSEKVPSSRFSNPKELKRKILKIYFNLEQENMSNSESEIKMKGIIKQLIEKEDITCKEIRFASLFLKRILYKKAYPDSIRTGTENEK